MFSKITFSKMIKIIFQQYKQSIKIWIFMSPESLRWPIVIRLSLSSVVQASSYNIFLHIYMYNQGQLLQYQFLVCIKLLIDKSTPNSKMYKLTTPNASWTVPNIQKSYEITKKNPLEEEGTTFSGCEYMYIVKMSMKFFLIIVRSMAPGILV